MTQCACDYRPAPARCAEENVGRLSDGDRCLFVTEVLNFVNHRTADGSDVSSLPDACRSDTSAVDRIICEA
ncbi:hypothetical protein DPMN_028513 [Dreissena polymorpha]|uniref:Uncharacterized protein n=1 Tax=Dreissena polymorpha TaxID=45954 RepID=A0A9D4LX25_DREPO|nr:hypothetical protein DPMN_028513 [Dreissena polymorpha]